MDAFRGVSRCVSRRRRWEISIFSSLSATAENFPEFFQKISSFREILA
jgi:hypothetical protein